MKTSTKWNGPYDSHFSKIVTEFPFFTEIPMENVFQGLNPISQCRRDWSYSFGFPHRQVVELHPELSQAFLCYCLTSKSFGTKNGSFIDSLNLVPLCHALSPEFYDDSNISSTVLLMTHVWGILCSTSKILNGSFILFPTHPHLLTPVSVG